MTTDSINTFRVDAIKSKKGLGYTPRIRVIIAKGSRVKTSLRLISGISLYFSLAGPKNIL